MIKTIKNNKKVAENVWRAGMQASSSCSIPGPFGGAGGTRCTPDQSGLCLILQCWLELVITAERFYTLSTSRKGCIAVWNVSVCTQRIWRMCSAWTVLLFGAVFKSFFLKDLAVNSVSPAGRQFCWMAGEEPWEWRGEPHLTHFSAQKAFPQNHISPFLYMFYLIKTPGRTKHF